MVDDGGPVGLDAVEVAFDDERVVSDAGIMLAATLAERLGIEALVDDWVHLGVRGAASRAGRKVMTLIYAMVLGADSIDDCDVLRAGRTGRLLGGWMAAPSTWVPQLMSRTTTRKPWFCRQNVVLCCVRACI